MEQLGQPRDKAFRRRLGIYLTGVAIGLALLGFVQIAKRATAPESAPSAESPPAADPNPRTPPRP